MKRKVVKQGTATLMVSLPSTWAKKFNVRKGDEISLEEKDQTLVISKDFFEAKKSTTIHLTLQTESAVRTAIVNAYRQGYDTITVHYANNAVYLIILTTLKELLIGFEIMKKGDGFCVLENVTEPSSEQFAILFRKIFYNIGTLIQGTRERLQQQTLFSEYKDIVQKIHQYDNFCRRVMVNKNLFGGQSLLMWTFMTLLVHGQRDLYHLNTYLDRHNVDFKQFIFFEHLKNIFDLLHEGYVKKDLVLLEKIHALEKKIIYQDLYKALQEGGKEALVLYHLANAIRQFYLASSPLMGLLLESKSSGN